MTLTGEKQKDGEMKPFPVPFCPLQTQHGLTYVQA
jgi:hypothetical protein